MLTTRVTKTNWGTYDTNQDVTYNGVRFNFNIQTHLNDDVTQYGWQQLSFEELIPLPNNTIIQYINNTIYVPLSATSLAACVFVASSVLLF